MTAPADVTNSGAGPGSTSVLLVEGLAIVNRLAVANGGSAALSDTPGGGLTVTIEFPLRTSVASGKPTPAGKSVPSGTSPSSGIPGDLNQF